MCLKSDIAIGLRLQMGLLCGLRLAALMGVESVASVLELVAVVRACSNVEYRIALNDLGLREGSASIRFRAVLGLGLTGLSVRARGRDGLWGG